MRSVRLPSFLASCSRVRLNLNLETESGLDIYRPPYAENLVLRAWLERPLFVQRLFFSAWVDLTASMDIFEPLLRQDIGANHIKPLLLNHADGANSLPKTGCGR